MLLKQDQEGYGALRKEYTNLTGQNWQTSKLCDVYSTLGDCNELYQKGLVLVNGQPNLRAIKEADIPEILRLVNEIMNDE